MTLEIGAHRPAPDHADYRAATEKYSAQVRLLADATLDESTYVAGQPFPLIQADDPFAAVKIAYNVERSRYTTDGSSARLVGGPMGWLDGPGAGRIEEEMRLGSARLLRYVGRLRPPEPSPPNPLGLLHKLALYPFHEPFDFRGSGILRFRYLDPRRSDDTWLYLPAFARVRRVSAAQESDGGFGRDLDPDSLRGFDGKIPAFTWKLLGIHPMLGSQWGRSAPAEPCADGLTLCERWELRPKVYVVEATPRRADYGYSRRILFVDAESSAVLYTDLYDRAGELWKVAVTFYRHDTRPNPGSPWESPFPRDFLSGFVIADVLDRHVTSLRYPGADVPGLAAWTIDTGAESAEEDAFTIGAMKAAGR